MMQEFKDKADWRERHLVDCHFVVRDAHRSTVSRVYICLYSFTGRRCMFRHCPMVAARVLRRWGR